LAVRAVKRVTRESIADFAREKAQDYTLEEFAAQGRAWECRALQSTRRAIRSQHVAVRALKRVETIVTREWRR